MYRFCLRTYHLCVCVLHIPSTYQLPQALQQLRRADTNTAQHGNQSKMGVGLSTAWAQLKLQPKHPVHSHQSALGMQMVAPPSITSQAAADRSWPRCEVEPNATSTCTLSERKSVGEKRPRARHWTVNDGLRARAARSSMFMPARSPQCAAS